MSSKVVTNLIIPFSFTKKEVEGSYSKLSKSLMYK